MGIRTIIAVIVTVIIMMGLQACAPVYIPAARHSHLLDEKGEVSSSVYAGTNGADLQAAYGISDHVGIAGAASFGSSGDEGKDDYHKHSYGELAVEYFSPMGGIGRFELIGGGGLGSATAVDNYQIFNTPQQVEATGKYNKLFLQSNVGLETSVVETGLALRLGHVTFTEFKTSSTTYGESESATFFEPALFARLGWKNIKLEGQVGTATPLTDEQDVAFDYESLLVSLGLHFSL